MSQKKPVGERIDIESEMKDNYLLIKKIITDSNDHDPRLAIQALREARSYLTEMYSMQRGSLDGDSIEADEIWKLSKAVKKFVAIGQRVRLDSGKGEGVGASPLGSSEMVLLRDKVLQRSKKSDTTPEDDE